MASVILKYPLDLTGKSANNLVSGEIHALGTSVNRAFVPSYGPFYTASLKVREAVSGTLLAPNVHYKAIQLYAEATEASGLEVCSIIVITDSSVANRVSIDYQVVGGEYSSSVYALQAMIDALNLDARTVAWGDIIGKPSEYTPAEHRHDAGDLYGFEYLVVAIEELKQAILVGDDASHDAIYTYIDQKNSNQDTALATLTTALDNHKSDTSNPHHTTKLQVGLGNVENYPVATNAQAIAGTDNQTYMTPLRVKDAISAIVGRSLGNHITDYNNPHQTTKLQVGLGNVSNFLTATDAQAIAAVATDRFMTPAGVRLAINNITAPNSAQLEGKTKAQVIAETLTGTAANATLFSGKTYAATQALWEKFTTDTVANYVLSSRVNTSNNWTDIIGRIPQISASGVLEVGKYIDFHDTNSVKDYDLRVTLTNGELGIGGKLAWTGIATGDGSGISNVNAPKLGGVEASKYALKTDLGELADTFQFTRNAEGASVVYVKIAEAATALGMGSNDLTLLVSGLENFGSRYGSTSVVRFGTRGGTNLDVVSLLGRETAGGSSVFGTVVNAGTGKTELWLKSTTHRNKLTISVLSQSNVDVAIGATTTAPAGVVWASPDTVLYAGDTIPLATNATKFSEYTAAEFTAEVLKGTAANATKFGGKTFAEATTAILAGTAAAANTFGGFKYVDAKADILSGKAAAAGTADTANLLGAYSYTQIVNNAVAAANADANTKYILKTDAVNTTVYADLANKIPRLTAGGNLNLGSTIRFNAADSTYETVSVTPDRFTFSAPLKWSGSATGDGLYITNVNAAKVGGKTLTELDSAWTADIATALANYIPSSKLNTVGTWDSIVNKVPVVNSTGVIELGRYVDMHLDGSINDYDLRLAANKVSDAVSAMPATATTAAVAAAPQINELVVTGNVRLSSSLYKFTGDGSGLSKVNAAELGGLTTTELRTNFQDSLSYIQCKWVAYVKGTTYNNVVRTAADYYGRCGIYVASSTQCVLNDTAGLSKINNVNIKTWYGFSVSSSEESTNGKVAFSVNARTGEAFFANAIHVNGWCYASGLSYGNNTMRIHNENDTSGLSQRNNVDIASWKGFSISQSDGLVKGAAADVIYDGGTVMFSVNSRQGDFWARGVGSIKNLILTSDRNVKTDLVPITDAVTKVNQLAGYTFNWLDNGKESAGIMAQDLQAVLPQSVKENDGILSIELTGVCGLLIEAVKQLSAEIAELKRG